MGLKTCVASFSVETGRGHVEVGQALDATDMLIALESCLNFEKLKIAFSLQDYSEKAPNMLLNDSTKCSGDSLDVRFKEGYFKI